MSEAEIRIAIAEACGWSKDDDVLRWRHPRYNGSCSEDALPDYLNDLNAMKIAEDTLFASNPGYFERAHFYDLLEVVTGFNAREQGWDGDARLSCQATNATARQRAEAFLKTSGKWRE